MWLACTTHLFHFFCHQIFGVAKRKAHSTLYSVRSGLFISLSFIALAKPFLSLTETKGTAGKKSVLNSGFRIEPRKHAHGYLMHAGRNSGSSHVMGMSSSAKTSQKRSIALRKEADCARCSPGLPRQPQGPLQRLRGRLEGSVWEVGSCGCLDSSRVRQRRRGSITGSLGSVPALFVDQSPCFVSRVNLRAPFPLKP